MKKIVPKGNLMWRKCGAKIKKIKKVGCIYAPKVGCTMVHHYRHSRSRRVESSSDKGNKTVWKAKTLHHQQVKIYK